MTKALRYELFPERRSISTANNLNITMRVGCERTLELVMQCLNLAGNPQVVP
jgi:hypothetical protein